MSSMDDTKPSMEDTIPNVVTTPLADFKFPPIRKDENSSEEEEEEEEDYKYNPNSPLPLISLKQGLKKKSTPWALSSWVKLALTLDGRDKITKVCQYATRFLAWWFAGTNQMKRFEATSASFSTSRKAFRLGRSLIEIQKIRESGFLEIFFYGSTTRSDPAWRIVGNALKMIGLMGFWAGDNVSFLAGSGLLDNYGPGVTQEDRVVRRNQLKTQSSNFGNRFYFFGAVAGLVTSLRAYLSFRGCALREAHERLVEATEQVAESDRPNQAKSKQLWRESKAKMEKAREEQFSLFLALLKSCVDVMVFSNNPGIDLHKKFRGKKNHEGFHSICGLISASTVLYNSYPNAKK